MNTTQRLERLERTVRRQRVAIGLILAGLGLAVLGGMQELPVTELALRKLVIVDDKGRERIVAEGGTKEPGVATLAHLDEHGIPRIFTGTFPGGTASLMVADKLGKGRLVAATYAGGSASLVCADAKEAIRIATGTRANGSAELMMFDGEGNIAWEETAPGAMESPAKAP